MKRRDVLEVVRLRLEQAQSVLQDAPYLLEGGRSPQSVINRCYYAMFYAVLALLQQQEKTPRKHRGVISLFDRHFVHTGVFSKEFSWDLHEVFQLGEDADYQFSEPLTRETAGKVLDRATRFVQAIQVYLERTAIE